MTTMVLSEAASAADDLSVWPASTSRLPHGGLAVGGVDLADLAERFDTPLYVLDEAEVRGRCRAYREAFPGAEVLYAAKAFLSRAMVRWVREEELGLDVCSAGELELAVTAGFPAERIVLHGNAKSPRDLGSALRLGVGRIVIDSTSEISRIAAAVGPDGRQKVMVRVVPGVSAGGHDKIRTGTEGQKFGLSLVDGSALHAVARVLAQPQLELTGLHCHIGSQITSPKPYLTALRRMVGLMARIRDTCGVVLPELDLGGGHGIAYRPGEPALDPAGLARKLRSELARSCAAAGMPVPRLVIEPGRAVVGPAGVVVYRVLAVKQSGETLFVAVDGGMSDNPRPALYGVRYAPRLIGRRPAAEPRTSLPRTSEHRPSEHRPSDHRPSDSRPSDPRISAPRTPAPRTAALRTATVVGRHCEAGDVLAAGVELPGDVRPGDLIAVPVAGAYQLSMASGYNLVGRPPVVAVHEGTARLLVRRETLEDLRHRDIGG